MIIVTLTNGMVYDSEVAMTRAELIEMISDGCFIKEPIESIFYMSEGGYIDITASIAKAIWDEYNADDRAPHHELEQWLNRFGHDCTDFGLVPEPRSMFVPPYRG
ncbi:hypothetical protein UFOVP122_19 [uncultured Caudovirales phage]|uniref:Uncharacterized protein n=1 Tax=uncultured Caudovirales phage TaxID=2100421 RepID=A0A6J5LCK9_9CAUD|nr:hypothetical protein UFOVP122_19 [uncultured Caudovirales phage]